jgi:hypothetical protein
MKLRAILFFLYLSISSYAQEQEKSKFNWSAYIDIYYQYDFNKPSNNNRPSFVYSHNRHNEFNLNLGYLKVGYADSNVRANLALAAGTYMNANYASEPDLLRNIFEANAGIRLGRKNNLWLDAGIFSSHIGFETAISKDCWTMTRSMMADNSPYYEAGARLTYTTNNGRLLISLLALNGWQRIKRLNGNSLISWGSQFQYKPNSRVLINYSNFIGTDKPDSARQMRYFHNVYSSMELSDRLSVLIGFDIGQEKRLGSVGYDTWFTPVGIVKYKATNLFSISGRVEHYNDRSEVIIASNTQNGFQTNSYSLTLHYLVRENAMLRVEARSFKSKDKVFEKNNIPANSNYLIACSLAINL